MMAFSAALALDSMELVLSMLSLFASSKFFRVRLDLKGWRPPCQNSIWQDWSVDGGVQPINYLGR